jgi:uncharacterized repeat protein (TIGR01451 family)
MFKKQNDLQPMLEKGHRRLLAIAGAALAFLFLFAFAQLMTAQGNDSPDAPTSPPAPAPYSRVVSSTADLLAAPPSIKRYVAAHAIPTHLLQPGTLQHSTAAVAPQEAPPGGIVRFTITLFNSGNSDVATTMTNELPDGLAFVSAERSTELGVAEAQFGHENGVISWQGTIGAGRTVLVHLTARLADNLQAGMALTNVATISGAERVERAAVVTVGRNVGSPIQFLPLTTYGLLPDPGPVSLDVGEVNSQNQWLISWTPSPGVSAYELEESQSADFSNPTLFTLAGSQTSLLIEKEATFRNQYFYRIRGRVGEQVGPWSNVDTVVGAYRDDFTDPNSGWSLRRTTYIEKVISFYDITPTRNWLVLSIEDRWDWGISSPLAPAPRVPYAIEYVIQHGNPVNLVSQGVVFSGDRPGATCPDPSTVEGWYEHELCFNHFYNPNVIFYGPLKMLFERVDELVWCPSCGGSPMKRLGDVDPNETKTLKNVAPEGWNLFRIEVRESGIKIFAGQPNGELKLEEEYSDTRWIPSPYFGLFASTDEYPHSVARLDYIEVLPLDN